LVYRVFGILQRGQGVPRLRARPKGAALWNPAAFEKAGETFFALRALLFILSAVEYLRFFYRRRKKGGA